MRPGPGTAPVSAAAEELRLISNVGLNSSLNEIFNMH